MDYVIEAQPMISGQGEALSRSYNMYIADNGRAFFVADVEDAASHIYVTDSDDWSKRGEGFAGATLPLRILNGTDVIKKLYPNGGSVENITMDTDGSMYFQLRGGWHTNSDSAFRNLRSSNAEALWSSTGVDIRQTHRTFVVIAEDRTSNRENGYRTILKNVLYIDKDGGELGWFKRGSIIAVGIARALGKPVYCYSQGSGGSSCGPVKPDDEIKLW